MKEMNYTAEGKFEILESATYEGYNYLVVSYGTHPCCYVQMDENHTFFDENKYKWDWDLPISCHGDITFRGEFGKKYNVQGSFIGWDYCHCDDYSGYNPTFGGREYTTEELIQDCQDVIGQIIQFEVEQQQKQEEADEYFLEEAVTMSGLIYGDVNPDFVDGAQWALEYLKSHEHELR